MTFCVDTDVLIDCSRGRTEALAWVASVATDNCIVPGVVAMELIHGSRDARELKRNQEFIKKFDVAWADSNEFVRAFEILGENVLTSGISIPDALVAAAALERGIRLYTRNVKHFRTIKSLDVQSPYTVS